MIGLAHPARDRCSRNYLMGGVGSSVGVLGGEEDAGIELSAIGYRAGRSERWGPWGHAPRFATPPLPEMLQYAILELCSATFYPAMRCHRKGGEILAVVAASSQRLHACQDASDALVPSRGIAAITFVSQWWWRRRGGRGRTLAGARC